MGVTTMRDLQQTYRSASVQTASPARLLVMLMERLVLDCVRGLKALESGQRAESHREFLHAQRILEHLSSTLDVEGMPAGEQLLALYDWTSQQLVKANVYGDRRAAMEALTRAQALCDMWREAAQIAAIPAARAAQ